MLNTCKSNHIHLSREGNLALLLPVSYSRCITLCRYLTGSRISSQLNHSTDIGHQNWTHKPVQTSSPINFTPPRKVLNDSIPKITNKRRPLTLDPWLKHFLSSQHHLYFDFTPIVAQRGALLNLNYISIWIYLFLHLFSHLLFIRSILPEFLKLKLSANSTNKNTNKDSQVPLQPFFLIISTIRLSIRPSLLCRPSSLSSHLLRDTKLPTENKWSYDWKNNCSIMLEEQLLYHALTITKGNRSCIEVLFQCFLIALYLRSFIGRKRVRTKSSLYI